MAIENETETIEVVEEKKMVGGKMRKVRRTIRTVIEEEIVDDNVPTKRLNVLCRCVTPSGVANFGTAKANGDGTYALDVNASESGVHHVYIELDGAQIPGSPFMIRIESDQPNQVRMYGAGLESGLIWDYKGLFHVDTKGAGKKPGNLKVNVSGPKGGFDVFMSRDRTDSRIVDVSYKPTVAGIYVVSVLWCNEHIEGSPKEVFVSPNPAVLRCWLDDPEKCKRDYDIMYVDK